MNVTHGRIVTLVDGRDRTRPDVHCACLRHSGDVRSCVAFQIVRSNLNQVEDVDSQWSLRKEGTQLGFLRKHKQLPERA